MSEAIEEIEEFWRKDTGKEEAPDPEELFSWVLEKLKTIDWNDDKINYKRIETAYNEICVSFPRLIKLSTARKRKIKTRMKEGVTYERFEEAFRMMEASDFLNGKQKNWQATFDWLIENDSNIIKVLEGNYKNKSKGKEAYNHYKERLEKLEKG